MDVVSSPLIGSTYERRPTVLTVLNGNTLLKAEDLRQCRPYEDIGVRDSWVDSEQYAARG